MFIEPVIFDIAGTTAAGNGNINDFSGEAFSIDSLQLLSSLTL